MVLPHVGGKILSFLPDADEQTQTDNAAIRFEELKIIPTKPIQIFTNL